MVTSNMQHARFIEEWEYFTWRILLMILSLSLSLSVQLQVCPEVQEGD